MRSEDKPEPMTERAYLALFCRRLALPFRGDETTGELLRQIILNLAGQQPIEIAPEASSH